MHKGFYFAILIAILVYIYRKDSSLQHLDGTLSGLLRAEKKIELATPKKIAVGFGACEDIYVEAFEVFEKIDGSPPENPVHGDDLNTKEDLENMFTYFFQHGAAAERFVDNITLFKELVEVANSLEHSRHILGGNAPVMANRFLLEGCNVILGASMDKGVRKWVPSQIKVLGNKIENDDIHLILEYTSGSKWGPYIAPRANRFIVHHDVHNPYVDSLESFEEELKTFNPDLIVIGGLQMMDNYPFNSGERQGRLMKMENLLKKTPQNIPVHLELASFADENCFQDVLTHVLQHSDSLGMNEQELPNLYSMLVNGSITLVSDSHPRIATTLDQMRLVYKTVRDIQTRKGFRKLTRIHLHTLAYQAIMTTKGSSWKNTMSAAAKASLTAHRHVCGTNEISIKKAKLLMDDAFTTSKESDGKRVPFNSERPVSCWEEEDVSICIAPVLVCTEVVQTGGGGDNVSSAGLVLQI